MAAPGAGIQDPSWAEKQGLQPRPRGPKKDFRPARSRAQNRQMRDLISTDLTAPKCQTGRGRAGDNQTAGH